MIIALGTVVQDTLVYGASGPPSRGALRQVERIALAAGGLAATFARDVARLGGAAAVVGLVGDDLAGQFVRHECQRDGVDLRALQTRHGSSAASVVWVGDDGERSFWHAPGVGAALSADDLDLDLFDRATHLHVGGAFLLPALDGAPLVQVLTRAKQRGLHTSLDPGWPEGNVDWLFSALPLVDEFFPNAQEAERLTGCSEPCQAAERFLQARVGAVHIKRGSQGVLYGDQQGWIEQPGLPARARDATGCGEAYAAGYLWARYEGWPVAKSVQLGALLGALTVEVEGGAWPKSSLRELNRALKERTSEQ